MSRLAKDICWLLSMWRIRRQSRDMLFSERRAFLSELRPLTEGCQYIAWPDALLHISGEDVTRAAKIARKENWRIGA